MEGHPVRDAEDQDRIPLIPCVKLRKSTVTKQFLHLVQGNIHAYCERNEAVAGRPAYAGKQLVQIHFAYPAAAGQFCFRKPGFGKEILQKILDALLTERRSVFFYSTFSFSFPLYFVMSLTMTCSPDSRPLMTSM